MALWHTVIVLLITITTQVLGSGVFELDLHQFKNDYGLLANGTTCAPDCKTFFRVCLKNYQIEVSPGDCIFGSVVTPVLGANSFTIMEDDTFSKRIRLPFQFGWPGSFSLIIEAWHSSSEDPSLDISNPERLISFFATRKQLEVGAAWSLDVQTGKQTELRYSYRFICNENYYGDSCTKKCAPRDDHFGHYTCDPDGEISCLPGWKGKYCEEPICLEGCSERNGNCSKPGECICRTGWQGALCDECMTARACKHGTCERPWQCICEEGWGGLLCDQDLNYCTHHKPCRNGATCMNTGQGSYTCSCLPGFTGVNCEMEVRECDSKPCRNGGQCVDLEEGYRCLCPSGFEGDHCEHRLLTCADAPCFHNGRCRDKDNGRSYVCECPAGYTGLNCERRVDKCTTLSCANGGRCVIRGSARLCNCPSGFTGQRCEININECATNPCAQGSTCLDRINGYTCVCPPSYTGFTCDRPINRCASKSCLNGGTCTGDGSCSCPPFYSGSRCQDYNVPASVTASPTAGEEPREHFHWPAVALGVGLVVIFVLLCMVMTIFRHIQQQRNKENQNLETMNNLSDFQKDNVISALLLKNTNKKVVLDVDCPAEKMDYKQINYHSEYKTSKEYKDPQSHEQKNHNCEKHSEKKPALSRIHSKRPECRISTISSSRESMYQSVFVITEERNECVIATEV
ncbi:delta-like protein 4 [Chanos chanos]|uniref:Delta-like protein n=1 Tax=Chanos chanos TaxID=29144 RepID=A0A6J2W792_CHACN|nr:delta-like protein 4 [Chanos chanos]